MLKFAALCALGGRAGGQQAALFLDANYEDAENNAAAARTSLQVPEPSSPRSLHGQSHMARQHALHDSKPARPRRNIRRHSAATSVPK
jgi:hypothetical protein